MRIGSHKLKNNLFLAPMAGVTDRPFRQLCKKLGAGMAFSEMVSANSLLWGSNKTLRRADHTGEDEPSAVQIVGADPRMIAAAARFNVDRGAQIIDINMGCPAKKVCNAMAGSALLRDETLVRRIIETVVKSVDVPVTLKMRTGWDHAHRNGITVARIAEDAGIQVLTVHGRTRADAYRGEAEYDMIAAIKRAVRIPVIANGDIATPERARWVLRHTGADGIMIGRAAQGNPWIFREVEHFLTAGIPLPPPRIGEIRQTLVEHLENLYRFYGERTGVRVARKHISWYSKGLHGSAAFRDGVNRIERAEEQLALVSEFFDNQYQNVGLAA